MRNHVSTAHNWIKIVNRIPLSSIRPHIDSSAMPAIPSPLRNASTLEEDHELSNVQDRSPVSSEQKKSCKSIISFARNCRD